MKHQLTEGHRTCSQCILNILRSKFVYKFFVCAVARGKEEENENSFFSTVEARTPYEMAGGDLKSKNGGGRIEVLGSSPHLLLEIRPR